MASYPRVVLTRSQQILRMLNAGANKHLDKSNNYKDSKTNNSSDLENSNVSDSSSFKKLNVEKVQLDATELLPDENNSSKMSLSIYDYISEDSNVNDDEDPNLSINVAQKAKEWKTSDSESNSLIFENQSFCNPADEDILTDEENDPEYKPKPTDFDSDDSSDTNDADDVILSKTAKLTTNSVIRENERSNQGETTSVLQTNRIITNEVSNEVIRINKEYMRTINTKKTTPCKYCGTEVTNFERHLQRHHLDEKEVLEFSQISTQSKEGRIERKRILALIRNAGKFEIFLKNNDSELLPCSHCKKLLSKHYLRRHFKKCFVKPVNDTGKNYNHIGNSQTLLACASDRSNTIAKLRVKDEVFSIMSGDHISMVVKSDFLITQFGENYLKKHKRRQIVTCCSNKMREFSRLLIEIRKRVGNDSFRFMDVLDPSMFNVVVAAAKTLGGYDEEKKTFKSPSTAMHLGTSLKQMCDICIRLLFEKHAEFKTNNEEKLKDVKRFKLLIEGQWITEITSLALKDLAEKKWNKPTLLPLTEEIKKFREYIYKISAESYEKLQQNPNNIKEFKNLVETSLAATILYNRRRIGDVQYTTVESYLQKTESTNLTECMDSLTESEKALTQQYKRVVAGGKGSREIVILFPTNVQDYINLLLKIRENSEIVPQSNPFLFAYPKVMNNWVRGDVVIKKLAKRSGISNPDLMTSNKLRKQIATIMQILNLNKTESKQFAKFMGHTEKTHEEFYELTQDVYQTAKISKLLNLMDTGNPKMIEGKNLDNIDISEELAEEDENITPEVMMNQPSTSSSNSQLVESNSIIPDETEIDIIKTTKGNRVRWNKNQKRVVEEYFKKHVKQKIAPKKQECQQLKEKHLVLLDNLDWVKIKTYVYNMYKNN